MSTVWPSGEKEAVFTTLFSAGSINAQLPVAACQSRTDPSKEAVSSCRPPGAKLALLSAFVWPLSTWMHSPEGTLQTRAVQSMEAVITWLPLLLKAEDFTTSVCPTSVCTHSPVSAVQKRAVLSLLPVTISQPPSGDQLADLTSSWWPRRIRRQSPVLAHQMRAASLSEAPTTQRPSGENSPVSAKPSSSQTRAPVSVHHTSPSPPAAMVKSWPWPGERAANSTGPAGSMTVVSWPPRSGQMRAVLSAEAVRHRRGVCTRSTEAPSERPASSNVNCTSKTRDSKRKCRATPALRTSLRTASRKHATLSLGFT
mmetsp:Transcript_74158/g.221295  ORF Transcript_74158/g.221295 Transcript_74158/m.221295 type:complete len:312 (-) Transcript_74158:615-1550(-)